MTNEQRETFAKMADALDAEVSGLVANFGGMSRELSIAITKIEEGVMWIRRAVERA